MTALSYHSLLQFLYGAPIGLIQTDAAGLIEIINPTSARLLMPLSPDGRLENLFTALEEAAPQLRGLAAASDGVNGIILEALRIPLGPGPGRHPGPEVLSLSMLRLSGTRLVAVLVDATLDSLREREALARELGAAARFDTLTRLPNRLAVVERLQFVLQRAEHQAGHRFALFQLRCSRLEQVEKTYGRAVHDDVARQVADRLRAVLGRFGSGADVDIAGHIGDDEFALLLGDAGPTQDIHAVARQLADIMAEPYPAGPDRIHCGVSIGVVVQETAAGDADGLMQDAGLAVAEAARAGAGGAVVFDAAMRRKAALRAALETDLRRALAEDQLFVVYQPVVGLQGRGDGDVDRSAGVEALVRWHHPVHGVLRPDMFIGLAEECGLIGALGEFVLRAACTQFAQWQSSLGARAPRLLAVNLSGGQLGSAGLVAAVGGILEAARMRPDQLQLEVTESLAAQSPEAQSRLRELKALGVTLALDDFGTGYSALSSLHLLPIDTVKIDRSFIIDAVSSPHHRALIDATIRVAHALDMTTVAEGIENEGQARVVRELGCDKGQGYLYSPPLLPADLVDWLTGP